MCGLSLRYKLTVPNSVLEIHVRVGVKANRIVPYKVSTQDATPREPTVPPSSNADQKDVGAIGSYPSRCQAIAPFTHGLT